MASASIPLTEIALASSGGTDLTRKIKRCVLLIEDDKDAMRWVQYALKQYGSGKYQLDWKRCLSDGLRRLLNGGIDLILLDLGLGDCSSPFTETWVRKAAPRVPVVVLTGDPSEEGERNTSGFRNYLVKGQVSPSELVEAISGALAEATPPKGSPRPVSNYFGV